MWWFDTSSQHNPFISHNIFIDIIERTLYEHFSILAFCLEILVLYITSTTSDNRVKFNKILQTCFLPSIKKLLNMTPRHHAYVGVEQDTDMRVKEDEARTIEKDDTDDTKFVYQNLKKPWT